LSPQVMVYQARSMPETRIGLASTPRSLPVRTSPSQPRFV
jgi:hypothetical protein